LSYKKLKFLAQTLKNTNTTISSTSSFKKSPNSDCLKSTRPKTTTFSNAFSTNSSNHQEDKNISKDSTKSLFKNIKYIHHNSSKKIIDNRPYISPPESSIIKLYKCEEIPLAPTQITRASERLSSQKQMNGFKITLKKCN